nr:NRDE family protein [Natranaeroarchaeum aerophilus]
MTLAWQVFEGAPVAVAANRDEVLDRPSAAPGVLDTDPQIVAPQDEEASGTWIGYNEHGVVVGITNRWNDADLAGERSRGLLVRDALDRESAEAAARYVERTVRDHEYAGFNLVVVDRNSALYYEWDGRLQFRQFEPGVHVVVNVGADGRYTIPIDRKSAGKQQAENADRIREVLSVAPGEGLDGWRSRAESVLGNHEYGVCIHGDGFGTRSSSIIALGEDGASYRFADGPPCETTYRDVDIGN